ncbi:MAG: histone deacetylase [bacterium]
MKNNKFAIYMHKETFQANKDDVEYIGNNSAPHFNQIREKLSKIIEKYQEIPLYSVDFDEYKSIHSNEYIEKLKLLSRNIETDYPRLSLECENFWHLIPGYKYSLGGLYSAIKMIKKNELNRTFCFSLPGHHAHPDWGHGYCLVNTQAAAAKYAQKLGYKNILIIDWDFHHGDGTQDIFKNDDTVHTFSIHNYIDLYMSKMEVTHNGTTEYSKSIKEDTNIPILDSLFHDKFPEEVELKGNFYRANNNISIFKNTLNSLQFKPDMIFIFAGADAHKDDLGENVTEWDNDNFKELTKITLDFSKKNDCPVISSPGGGYNQNVSVSVLKDHIELMANY